MTRRAALAAVVALALLAGCGGDDSGGDDSGGDNTATDGTGTATSSSADAPSTTTTTVPAAAQLCDAPRPTDVGTVSDPDLVEISGLVASRANPGLIWAHNDSGNRPDVFLLDEQGATHLQLTAENVTMTDWEDIAISPAGDLLIADIGDNREERPEVTVYAVPEPSATGRTRDPTLHDLRAITLTYPDGAHDAEALFADPVENRLVIVTKDLGGQSLVFATPLDAPGPLEQIAELDLGLGDLVTAADISAAGDVIALRTYVRVLVYERRDGESLAEAFGREPCSAPAALEQQGEALALDPDGLGYVTISEGEQPTVHRVRAATAPASTPTDRTPGSSSGG